MRVFITGATGLIGRNLTTALTARDDQVVVVSRHTARATEQLGNRVVVVAGNPQVPGDWMQALDGCDAVVNLAGEPIVGRRWTEQVKQEIVASRIQTTRNLAGAISQAAQPPAVFISSSAVGYYGFERAEYPVDELQPPGNDFLGKFCAEWEAAAELGPRAKNTRQVIFRISVVLDRQGGALGKMLPVFRWGLGGVLGSGEQPFPWIHIQDLVAMILWSIDNPEVSGVLNACAPEQVTNRDLTEVLGQVLRRPTLFAVPAFALRLLFGEGAQILLGGKAVIPKRATELGFTYAFPDLKGAIRNLV
jgi:uncharacterized protein (TIGR01777 family)